MKKRIAVFSTAWNGEHIGSILQGMSLRAAETQTELYIFNTYGGFQTEVEFNECEYHIFDLPFMTEFDGAIVLSNNIYSTSRLTGLLERIRKTGIPCISVEQKIDGFHFIGTDNYQAMYEMVEHLIKEHGCKSFQYVGGPAEHIEAQARKQAFLDVLDHYHIPVNERLVQEYNFTGRGGEEAFLSYLEQKLPLPDAVVCANDDMALGYINMAERYGYRIPQDVAVTGFDNLLRAKSYRPGIASVERCKEQLGRSCVDEVLGMIEGKEYPMCVYVPFAISPNESCGCKREKETRRTYEKTYSDLLYQNERIRLQINYLQKNLMTCQNLQEFRETLKEELDHFGIKNFCVLLDEKQYRYEEQEEQKEPEKTTGYPEEMLVVLNKCGRKKEPFVIPTKMLFPEDFQKEDAKQSMIFMPLHQKGRNFGYCVMEGHLDYIVDSNLYYLLSVINVALETIRQNRCIRQLNRKLEHLYLYDSMTGIYNRFALQNFGIPLLEKNNSQGKRTLFLFADMDGLKKLNDTYGHETGDLAIKLLARILSGIHPNESYFSIRYGGDEFLMMGTCEREQDAEHLQEEIERQIEAESKKQALPIPLSVSIGYILTSVTDGEGKLDDYIRQADAMMYQIKQRRKRKEEKKNDENTGI